MDGSLGEETEMPNGRYFLNDIELEQAIKQMDDRQLLEFTARQTYAVSNLAFTNEKRIGRLESRSKKELRATGGIGAILGVAIASALDFLLRRG